ncbi:unnamed protein product [Somion occarium]|uniref:Glucose-methanol-choline oxidoreductase N-terminal domain-containing protein n=1 Tax=Somion occarium TaxID=3059160 RepID=A0ABP1DKB5_9APHY
MLVAVEEVANKSFDYVVIGGGNAGLPLAVRLSEDPTVSVLLLEAGDANLNHVEILRPGSFIRHFFGKEYVYPYMTNKQLFLNNSVRPWFRGKGLGGSAAVNFQLWMRPPAEEVNDLERLGNAGWNWDDFQRLIRKVERFYPPTTEVQQRLNSDCNNWNLGSDDLKLQQTVLNSGIELACNPLGGDPTGTFFAPCTYDPTTHTRAYPTTAYYLPNKERLNLKVLVFARGNRLITTKELDGSIVATAVELDHGGQIYTVNVTREVVLSSGTLKSPHILELSGIGRKDVLEKIHVPLKLELPGLGENVQEHLLIAISYEIRDDVQFDTIDLLRDYPELVEKHAELRTSGEGIFTMGLTNATFASVDTISSKARAIIQGARDAILAKIESYSSALQEQYKIQLERLENGAPSCEIVSFPGLSTMYNPPKFGKRYLTLAVGLNHPFSRGTIHSLSSDPAVDPEFDPHYLDHDIDLHIMTELVKFTRGLSRISPLKDVIAKEHNPGQGVQTDEEIREWIRDRCSSFWHTAGSCSMLPQASDGVVDEKLKVHGTTNIRVADLSILPLHFVGHPSSFVYYIAEKGAEIIKATRSDEQVKDL